MIRDTWREWCANWKELVIADLFCRLLAFIILTPVVGILFRSFVSLSGRTVLADDEILRFFVSPFGWAAFILVGACAVSVLAFEQASLLLLTEAKANGVPLTIPHALEHVASNALSVLRIAWRITAWTLLSLVPFAVAAGLTYRWLLTDADINFYLTHRPFEFKLAIGIAVALVAGWGAVLTRVVPEWLLALPCLLFDRLPVREVLPKSRAQASPHRWRMIGWVLVWLTLMAVVSLVLTSFVAWLGQRIVQFTASHLWLLILLIGMLFLVWTITNLAVNVLGTTTFAVMLTRMYRVTSPAPQFAAIRSQRDEHPWITALLRWPRRRPGLLLLTATIISALIGLATCSGVRVIDDIQVTAHRGASGKAPENTLAAVRQAVADQADWVEIDVQETADGQVVVAHDRDFKKVANSDLRIERSTLGQLREIDIGSWYGPEFADERIPTLDQVLEICRGKAGVNIELKYYGDSRRLESRVIEIVERHEMQNDVVVMSLKQAGIVKMRQLRPNWRVGLLSAMAIGDLTKIDADFFAVNTKLATYPFVAAVHGRNKQVFVWTVNDRLTMSMMASVGVDNIITDHPAEARRLLEERAKLSLVERLLLELVPLFGKLPEPSSAEDEA